MSTYYPQGFYQMEVTEQRLGKSSNGNPQWMVRGNIQQRIHDDGSTEPVERNYDRTIYRVITDKTIEYLLEDLSALGCPGIEKYEQLDQDHPQAWDIRGQWIEVVCTYNTYQGNQREQWNIKRDREATALEVKPLDAKELRDLNNLFGKALKGLKANGKQSAKPAGMVSSPKTKPTPAQIEPDLPPAPTDDDMPF